MAYINYNTLLESEFDKIVSMKEKIQVVIINQLNLKARNAYKKDEKITTKF